MSSKKVELEELGQYIDSSTKEDAHTCLGRLRSEETEALKRLLRAHELQKVAADELVWSQEKREAVEAAMLRRWPEIGAFAWRATDAVETSEAASSHATLPPRPKGHKPLLPQRSVKKTSLRLRALLRPVPKMSTVEDPGEMTKPSPEAARERTPIPRRRRSSYN